MAAAHCCSLQQQLEVGGPVAEAPDEAPESCQHDAHWSWVGGQVAEAPDGAPDEAPDCCSVVRHDCKGIAQAG